MRERRVPRAKRLIRRENKMMNHSPFPLPLLTPPSGLLTRRVRFPTGSDRNESRECREETKGTGEEQILYLPHYFSLKFLFPCLFSRYTISAPPLPIVSLILYGLPLVTLRVNETRPTGVVSERWRVGGFYQLFLYLFHFSYFSYIKSASLRVSLT